MKYAVHIKKKTHITWNNHEKKHATIDTSIEIFIGCIVS